VTQAQQATNPGFLDYHCAKYGQCLVAQIPESNKQAIGKATGAVRKALGVLRENGPYATLLYLLSESGTGSDIVNGSQQWTKNADKSAHAVIATYLLKSVKGPFVSEDFPAPEQWQSANNDKSTLLREFRTRISEHMGSVVIVAELFERTLSYALYHLQALDPGSAETPGGAPEET